MIGATEIIIIFVIIGLIFFNKQDQVREIARALGKFSSEFKKEKQETEKEIEEIKRELKIK